MFILDTDIVIYHLKGNAYVQRALKKHINDSICITSITLMELYYGAYKSKFLAANLAKVRAIENALEIIIPGTESTEIFGMLKAQLEKQGQPIADLDLIIGACAMAHNATLVTNNTKHFDRIPGIKLVNWVNS